MDIGDLEIFVAALAAGSLSGAARRLKLTPMSVTRRIGALEQEVGARLIHRSTRSISLTPEGEALLPFAMEIVEAQEAAKAAVIPSASGAAGLLRISAPITLGRKVIVPLLPQLLEENPALRIDLGLSDAMVDIISSGIDVAIRIAPLKDSGLIARHLIDNPKHLYATPGYLAVRGTPRTIEDLESHECLAFSETTHWHFQVDGEERSVRIASRFTSSGVDGFLGACVSGVGIARLSCWDVRDELQSGALVRIDLERTIPQDLSVWAVYPTRRQILPKLQVFLAKLQASLKEWRASAP
ncbi:LysR family transcriptional regulator [Steroidobacter sp. S1-65]|uniref:LysR family transcriptional regulator n=1 Tax=Steroidobacter gossypii TaxID=2805490 RepID=A0ABS1WVA2_9GAMM|nr:LysR family transcriptional regulator [Steroidobacter gossypii]MBM0104898.1 LysR family transcriptional regulator [Steroidobacter gossypii]